MAMQNAVVYEIYGQYECEGVEILQVLEYDSDTITADMVTKYVQDTYGKKVQVMCGVFTERLVVKSVPTVVVDTGE